jgi:hypothetical protein
LKENKRGIAADLVLSRSFELRGDNGSFEDKVGRMA